MLIANDRLETSSVPDLIALLLGAGGIMLMAAYAALCERV
ncbi:hypothetical protein FHR90_001837 [Endobacter medicaginis]|uniref:Uncharacterized protein n=1 Tax=Endobacter medicaginis TaxID=1181271 RepID=A0A839UZF8_9PROT|nr:hypothetical protein [Endobacter medicaginis]